MNVRPQDPAIQEEVLEALMPVTEDPPPLTAAVRHAGLLAGATATGEAARRQLSVRIGLWMDERGAVRQARWRAVKDPALRACAEAACSLLESGVQPEAVDAEAVRAAAGGLAHGPVDRAEVVAAAVQAGFIASRARP
jgi:hypothetical protein